jgi:hypothetical protein
MESAISKSGGNASLASIEIEEGRVSTARWNPKGLRRSSGLESMGAIPTMNRSAKEGARSSRHYGDEGVIHPPLGPRCVRLARSGRTRRDPRRSQRNIRWYCRRSAATRTGSRFLKPGEVIEASIDGIGTLRMPVVAGEQPKGGTGARLPPVSSYRKQ